VNGIRGRRYVWLEPRVQKLVSRFVAAADDDGFLRGAQSPEGDFHRRLTDELGYLKDAPEFQHGEPRDFGQGVYCVAPSGEHLVSAQLNFDADAAVELLTDALEKWDSLPRSRRFAPGPIDPAGASDRASTHFPADGLVLVESLRDLPRVPPQDGSLAGSWNKDYAWFRNNEARAFLPETLEKGATREVPDALMKRLSVHHIVDYVHCIGYPYDDEHVERASLASTIESIERNLVKLRLTGASRTSQDGPRGQAGHDNLDQSNQWRGVEVTILGRATWDIGAGRFTQFDLVAIGQRWGGVSMSRWMDFDPNPIGFEFRLAGDRPIDRTPPYGISGTIDGDPYW
jgi:hypothetical protein